MVRDFRFLTVDDRYSVPTLKFVQAADPERARAMAEQLLRESPHHRAVQVWEDETLLFVVGAGAP